MDENHMMKSNYWLIELATLHILLLSQQLSLKLIILMNNIQTEYENFLYG